MLDEKRIKEIQKRVPRFLKEGIIVKGGGARYVPFFLKNARDSLDSARLLYEVSTSEDLKKQTGYPDFNGFLWVINSSYYSMFYMARALLESEGIKIKTQMSIHAVVFDTLVQYFYCTGKLEKTFIQDFEDAKEDSADLLGREKAKELIDDYFHEKRKRGMFTYELGVTAMQNKARTSLERAKRFNEEIRKMLS